MDFSPWTVMHAAVHRVEQMSLDTGRSILIELNCHNIYIYIYCFGLIGEK